MTSDDRFGQAAALIARGLAVVPLPPGGRVPEPGWQRLATRNPEVLPELLAGDRNIGVGCRASGAVVLDLDVKGAVEGRAVLAALADRLGEPWPETLTVDTPSGGCHLYFRVPADCTIGSSSGGTTALGHGIDVRGPGRRGGGYVVGPGSIVGGIPYVISHDVPLARLPGWIADRLTTA
ncbi:bifunctional DNA primase/polymerase [Streptomyces sp. NPDC048290]|uniref:bifunctional DNA primase/polymerase n=1 Tax=Streptomyces sp. NPDC048290 TaxID=3155811 RepID=UPI00342EAEF1